MVFARRLARAALALLGLGLVMTGCAAESSLDGEGSQETPLPSFDRGVAWEPEEPIVLPSMSMEQKLEFRADYLANVWAQAKSQWRELGDPPEVELVEFGDPRGGDQLLADCYSEAGYPAVASPQGGVEFPGGIQASPHYEVVAYTCSAKFTPDPLMLRDWNADQLGLLYDYRVEWLVPCLESFGLAPQDGPEKTTFVNEWPNAESESRRWHPEDAAIGSDNLDDILRACPPIPVDHFYG